MPSEYLIPRDGSLHPLGTQAADIALRENPWLFDLVSLLTKRAPRMKEINPTKELMTLGYIGKEPASDRGHFRIYPAGALMFDLLRQHLISIAEKRIMAAPLVTPLIYAWDRDAVQGQMGRFKD